MTRNNTLRAARAARNDEFYTLITDIEKEVMHYKEHFMGKTVYCNCDDPTWSEFWKFFMDNFKQWGLKRLISTHYEPDTKTCSYSLEICRDINGTGQNDDICIKPTIKQLPCNGDFRSEACIELLKEADIVVTNPPFSLFREYMAQLMKYEKKFLIIGNSNAVTYKEIFPLIKDNLLWYGVSRQGTGSMWFRIPDDFPEKTGQKVISGVRYQTIGSSAWFTNLDYPKRHDPLELREKYYGNEEKYPYYDNFDAIEVSHVKDIPNDYQGVMGVPITFLGRYCPEQFEIVGLDRYTVPKKFLVGGRVAINGKPCYARILIRRKKTSCEEESSHGERQN